MRVPALTLAVVALGGCTPNLDTFGRERAAFLVGKGSASELVNATTVSVWTSEPTDRAIILGEIRRRLPDVALVEGDSCARADIQYFVQEELAPEVSSLAAHAQLGSLAKTGRLLLNAHVHAQGYSCETTTALTWFDQSKSRRKMAKRFAISLCRLIRGGR